MDWFFGRNVNGLPLLDSASGGCYDGLTAQGINANQGAESLLAYLVSRLEIAALAVRAKEPALVSGQV